MEAKDILKSGCDYFDISIGERQILQFEKYYQLLTEWNKVMNLTTITEHDEVIQKHFLDSLSLVKAIDIKTCSNLIDVGTGAGFPGIPLKIVYPHLNVVLLDSLNKRVKFLNEVISQLGLQHICAVHGRAEDEAQKPEYREAFDVCVSRAVANLSSLSEYCIPFIKNGGVFVSYKSNNVDEELKRARHAVDLLGGKNKEIVKFTLPESDIERSLVVVQKIKQTPKKFPRKAGTPAKDPLR